MSEDNETTLHFEKATQQRLMLKEKEIVPQNVTHSCDAR